MKSSFNFFRRRLSRKKFSSRTFWTPEKWKYFFWKYCSLVLNAASFWHFAFLQGCESFFMRYFTDCKTTKCLLPGRFNNTGPCSWYALKWKPLCSWYALLPVYHFLISGLFCPISYQYFIIGFDFFWKAIRKNILIPNVVTFHFN